MARNALLIGVGKYDVVRPELRVVRNDLLIMQKALASSHYSVQQLGTEETKAPTRCTIRRTIRRFCAEAEEGSTLLLYFSGHGVHYNDRDYLIPSDATLEDPINVEEYLVPVDLSFVFDKCRAKTVVFFVDACRDGIELRGSSKGLSEGLRFDAWSEGDIRLTRQREAAVVFSCGQGELGWIAESGEFSLFTQSLAEVLDAAHPARTFREITESLQNRLNDLTDKNHRARQSVKICLEFDHGFKLLDREICEGPPPPDMGPLVATGIDETQQPIVASSFIDQPNNYRDRSAHACILFADLFGSTGFRLDHSESQAIKKVLLHNKVCSRVIAESGGIVAKHVGDRVMGVFRGSRCEELAVAAGIAIIRELEAENARRDLHFPYDLNTSVGIKGGRILRFHFDGCNLEEYAGDPIDIARRLCSLAGIGQVICDEDTFQKIGFRHADWSYSDPVERFIGGLDEPLLVRLVAAGGRSTNTDLIPLCGFTRRTRDAARDKAKCARQLFREKRFDDALRLCGEILSIDRGNFEANVCCAEILLDRVGAGSGNRFQALQEVVHQYLCVAKQIRPQANRVWRLLGRAYYLQAADSHEDVNKAALLSTAFERANMALTCAHDYMDETGEAQARILLASILREQARLDASRRAEYLARANEYCRDVAIQLGSLFGRARSDQFLIQAGVQADLGAPANVVEQILDQARNADPRNPRVYEALTEFCRTRG